MNHENSKIHEATPDKINKSAVIGGIAGPLLMLLGMLITAIPYVDAEGQRYNILNHFVSELGEVHVSKLAWVFNSSLILGGILIAAFMFVLAVQIKNWLRYPLGLLGIITAIAGALVGVYPMNNLNMHIPAASLFFNLGMLVSFTYSLIFLFGKNHLFPKWLAIPGFINAGLFTWFLKFPPSSSENISFEEGMQGLIHNRPDFLPLALLEWAIILGIIAWMLILAVFMYQQIKTKNSLSE